MKKIVFGTAVCLLFMASIASASIMQEPATEVSIETFKGQPDLDVTGVTAIVEQIAESILGDIKHLGESAQPADELTVEIGENVSFEQNSGATVLITTAGISLGQTGLFSSLTLR